MCIGNLLLMLLFIMRCLHGLWIVFAVLKLANLQKTPFTFLMSTLTELMCNQVIYY